MRISSQILQSIDESVELRCNEKTFSYVDAIGFSTKPTFDQNGDVLWCVTKSKTAEDLSWYGVEFDRRKNALTLARQHQRWTVLTDDHTLASQLEGRCIVVDDVVATLEAVQRYVISEVDPIVIGVTGSVGKTTAVALMEDVLSNYGPTLRLFAKRIAPLSLFEMVINQLTRETQFVVMEYSMFYRSHIATLCSLLPPTAGVLLNVEAAHIGIDDIETGLDIVNAKRALLDSARLAFVNADVARRFPEQLGAFASFDHSDLAEFDLHRS